MIKKDNFLYLQSILNDTDYLEAQPSFSPLYIYSQDTHKEVRWTLAEILSYDDSSSGHKLLLKLGQDENWIVRCEAYEALEYSNTLTRQQKVLTYLWQRITHEADGIASSYAVTAFYQLFLKTYKNETAYLLTILTNWFDLSPYVHTKITIAHLLWSLDKKDKTAFVQKVASYENTEQYYAEITLERMAASNKFYQ